MEIRVLADVGMASPTKLSLYEEDRCPPSLPPYAAHCLPQHKCLLCNAFLNGTWGKCMNEERNGFSDPRSVIDKV